MTASYNIVPVIQNPEINRGDTVEIEIYISGGGNIGRKRLHILHPYPELFREEVGSIVPGIENVPMDRVDIDNLTIHGSEDESNGEGNYVARPRDEVEEDLRTHHDLDIVATAIDIADWMFEPMPEDMLRTDESQDQGSRPPHFPVKLIESKWGNTPPFKMKLNIDENADPGDYYVDFIFTYETDLGVLSSRKSVEFHVNDWIEERQPQLKRAVVSAALLGLLVQTIAFLYTIFI